MASDHENLQPDLVEVLLEAFADVRQQFDAEAWPQTIALINAKEVLSNDHVPVPVALPIKEIGRLLVEADAQNVKRRRDLRALESSIEQTIIDGITNDVSIPNIKTQIIALCS
jgi:hypothetical protein